ncbi:MAG TPA: type VI secretion system ATPase TssH [Acidobacteriota bacterium]|nr:type VI secretion system ATPase TssH [Acidobacteriota bacterium]
MNVNLKSLIGKLNPTCRAVLEASAGLCLQRTHYDVEIEHLLIKLLDVPNTDCIAIFRAFEVNQAQLGRDILRTLDRFKTGNGRTPALSPRIPQLIQEAWLVASVEFGVTSIRTGHLLLALLRNEQLARIGRETSRELLQISVEPLQRKFTEVTAGSLEAQAATTELNSPADQTQFNSQNSNSIKSAALDQFTIDLTARARKGEIDPVLGRDFEIRQVIDILTRRRQNNPILTGEAGVGKTAVVEGLALRVAKGDVPEVLKKVAIRTLDLGLLQAGAGIKGEFESRLKSVIDEVKASPQPIILFIDEAHTMIGAGGQAGQNDAANLLKPALARGELRTIAATTWAEYKKYFEKDAALARRFQVVKVEEPGEAKAMVMMRGIVESLETHHNVRILDEAIEAAVKLSHRYITGRQLPDKSVSVLDTACARVAIGQVATPPAIEDAERQIEQLTTEIRVLERETVTGAAHDQRIRDLTTQRIEVEETRSRLKDQLDKESALINRIRDIRAHLEALHHGEPTPDRELAKQSPESLRTDLQWLQEELEAVQGETPLMQVCVTGQTIAEVISGWTGIPVGRMVTDEINAVLALKDRLEQRVVGQSQALESIAQRIRTSRASLTDPRRPVGVFLLVGPSGVGKTETALTLAETLYGGERNLITINMSEYQEAHTVSSLKGSPPGYVGYGEGGVLTEAVRRKPYSVVLLDEVEKAHPDVMELFYQVFDKGILEDGEGREIDFKNTVILLTSNVASDSMMLLCTDPEEPRPEPEVLVEAIRPALIKTFKPALLGRMVVVPYYPIADDVMRQIVTLQLGRIGRRLTENHNAAFSYDEAVVDEIVKRCTEVESGARNVDHILTGTMLPEMAEEVLARMAAGKMLATVHVSLNETGQFLYQVQ